jgi:hypothetical protein
MYFSDGELNPNGKLDELKDNRSLRLEKGIFQLVYIQVQI